MRIVCTTCQEELADIEVLYPFSASVGCGKCGTTVGHRFVVEDKPAVSLSLDQQIELVENQIETAAAKLKELKATPRSPTAASAS